MIVGQQPVGAASPGVLYNRLRCVNGSRAESGCTPQHGLGGEIGEFVDESHFACDPRFDQDAMAAPDHAHDLEAFDRGRSNSFTKNSVLLFMNR